MRFERLFTRTAVFAALVLSAALIRPPLSRADNTIASPAAATPAPPASPSGGGAAPTGGGSSSTGGGAAGSGTSSTGSGAAPPSEPNEFSGVKVGTPEKFQSPDGADITDKTAPPPLDEYNNVPTNLMIPTQAIVKDENGNDVDSGLHSGTKTGYEALLKLYQEQKFDEVAKGLEPLAKVNHRGAQELLGIMYEQGQGVPKDPHKAYDLLSQAADANRALAQHHLGVMYYQGEGVTKDPIVALMWLHIAIVHYPEGQEKLRAVKDRDAMYTLLTRREKERALTLAREWLAKKGEADLLDLQGL